jgi:alkylation response protein AidB-like acyl-CoA dehydrogenase
MDFNDSPEEAAYRAQVREWLAANAPEFEVRTQERRGGDQMEKAKGWQARKARDGYAAITWPKAWGGGGGTPIHSVIYGQEEAKYSVNSGPFTIGLGMCVPTVMTFADDETKQRFVGPAVKGEEIWCQLFSEPAGGSDVAAARTRGGARRGRLGDQRPEGLDLWRPLQRLRIVLVRTDVDAPKHKGLTMFWIDMKAPGSR